MLFSRDYRRPFWRGFLHAVIVLLYTIFITLIYLSIVPLFHESVALVVQTIFSLFLTVVSIAICGYFIFFEPVKKMLHHHFRAGSVMLGSTLGWLFIFLLIFVMGFIFSVNAY